MDKWERTRARKRLVLAHVEQGKTSEEACVLSQVPVSTFTKWRQDDEEFRVLLAEAQSRNRGLAEEASYTQGVPGDFQGFVTKFFPDRLPHLPHQIRLVRELQTLQPAEVVLFLLWPEAGKTATLEDYICRRLATDPNHRFRIVSATDQHAKRMIGFCQRRFTDTVEWGPYIARFGPFYEKNQERDGRPWSAHEITVQRAQGTERDRSIVATGWSGATTGSRIDTLIWDDVQIPENYSQAEKIFEMLRSAYFSRGTEMRTLIIGHRIGPGDIYDRLREAGLITREVILPAAGGGAGFAAEPGYPTIPEWWEQKYNMVHKKGSPCCGGLVSFRDCPDNGAKLTPLECLELQKHRMGNSWWSMYMQDPMSDEVTTFAALLDQCLDHDRRYGPLPKELV